MTRFKALLNIFWCFVAPGEILPPMNTNQLFGLPPPVECKISPMKCNAMIFSLGIHVPWRITPTYLGVPLIFCLLSGMCDWSEQLPWNVSPLQSLWLSTYHHCLSWPTWFASEASRQLLDALQWNLAVLTTHKGWFVITLISGQNVNPSNTAALAFCSAIATISFTVDLCGGFMKRKESILLINFVF